MNKPQQRNSSMNANRMALPLCHSKWMPATPPTVFATTPATATSSSSADALPMANPVPRLVPGSTTDYMVTNQPTLPADLAETSSITSPAPVKATAKRRIHIQYIADKNRRQITFSKRKAGIMKKVALKIFDVV